MMIAERMIKPWGKRSMPEDVAKVIRTDKRRKGRVWGLSPAFSQTARRDVF
jgi:hypothetical protein